MTEGSLRLRIDSPYPGESMSSFLSRAAQFYATSISALLNELLPKETQQRRRHCDFDLEPPKQLENRLSDAVADWRSPLAGHQGFKRWVLAQRSRHAYCPHCFLEDLEGGRTPYFRNDWIPALVTTCWIHGTPLFDWGETRVDGLRKLPKSWLYQLNDARSQVPRSMRRHLELLERLGTPDEDLIDVGGKIPLSEALDYLKRLQVLVEKPSAVAMPKPEPFGSEVETLRFNAYGLVEFSARYSGESKARPIAEVIYPEEGSDWIAPIPRGTPRREWKFSDHGIRQTGAITWRRCYLLFTARTLAGMGRFQSLFPLAPSTSPRSDADWWREWVRPRLCPEQQSSLDWRRRFDPYEEHII